MKGNKRVAGVAREKDYRQSCAFPLRDEVLSPEFVPAVGLSPLLEEVMSVNDSRNALVLFGLEAEGLPDFLAVVGADKRAHPGATAFRDRHHERVTAG